MGEKDERELGRGGREILERDSNGRGMEERGRRTEKGGGGKNI